MIIRNNIFNGEHNGVSAGSDMSGGTKNIFVYDCQFGQENKQMYVFNAKSNCDRGGVIENIYFKNNQVDTCDQLIRMEMEYKDIKYDAIEHPFPPTYRNLYFEDMTYEQVEEIGINLEGIAQSKIKNIHLKNLSIKKANRPINLRHVEDIYAENVLINQKKPKFC